MGSIKSKMDFLYNKEEICTSNTCKNTESYEKCKYHKCSYDGCINTVYIDRYYLRNNIMRVIYMKYCELHNCKSIVPLFTSKCNEGIDCYKHMCYMKGCDVLLPKYGGIYCDTHSDI